MDIFGINITGLVNLGNNTITADNLWGVKLKAFTDFFGNNTITIEDKITALFKITQYITKSQKTTGYLLSDTQTSQTKKSQLRGQQGLYFLLGGLLLQGIGVINQLQ